MPRAVRAEEGPFSKRFRFFEAVIAVGDEISVIGAGTREPDLESPQESDYRVAPTRLRVTNSEAARLSLLHRSR